MRWRGVPDYWQGLKCGLSTQSPLTLWREREGESRCPGWSLLPPFWRGEGEVLHYHSTGRNLGFPLGFHCHRGKGK